MSAMMLMSVGLTFLAVAFWRKTMRARLASLAAASVIFLSLLISGFRLVAVGLTGNGIDEAVLFHLRMGIEGAGYGDFSKLAILGVAYVTAISAFSFGVSKIVRSQLDRDVTWKATRITAGMAAALLSLTVNPASREIATLMNRPGESFGPAPDLYIQNDTATFETAPRNVVVLYLESVERTYLDETLFPGLTPNLSALETQALSFTNINQVTGTEWTIAGMTAGLCGIPLVAPNGNSMSRVDQFLPGATCIGDLLDGADFNLTYMGGADLEFAGKGLFFASHSFDTIQGSKELDWALPDKSYETWWGLYDDTLYSLVTQRFDELAAMDDPFGLFLLTLDTHSPDGHMARACDGIVYQDGSNAMLNAVHCADKMAGAFIRHILESDAGENTVLLVASDHLAMPNDATHLLEAGTRRNLVMFFGPDVRAQLNPRPGSTLDIGPTLLNLMGADIQGHGFGRDLTAAPPTLSEMERPINNILWTDYPYFTSLWSYAQLDNGIRVDLPTRKLFLGERFVEFPALFVLEDDLAVNEIWFQYDDDAQLHYLAATEFGYDQKFFWVDTCANMADFETSRAAPADEYCATYGTLGDDVLNLTGVFQGRNISFGDLQQSFQRARPTQAAYQSRLAAIPWLEQSAASAPTPPTPTGDVELGGHYRFTSAGFGTGESVVTNLDTGGSVTLVRGLTILGLNAGSSPRKLGHIDTCAYEEVLQDTVPLEGDFHSVITENSTQFGAFAILLHDSAICDEEVHDFGPLFQKTGLKDWPDLGYRRPYVALIRGDGSVQEYLGETETAVSVDVQAFIRPTPE